MNKAIWTIVVVIILVLALGFIAKDKTRNSESSGEPIKIGSISALTGVGVAVGEEERRGAELAVEEINENGGVIGRPLKLISEDLSIDKLKNAGLVTSKLINVDKVVGIIGAQWDEPAAAVLPIIEKAMIPMIGPNVTDSIETNNLGDYLFSTWYDNRVGINTILEYAKQKEFKTGTIIRIFDGGFWKFTSDLVAKNAPAYGIKIIDDININNPLSNDFRTFITKAKAKNPDFIFFVTSDPSQCVFFKQMKEQNFDVPVLTTEAAGNSASLAQCPEDLANLYFSTPSPKHDRYKVFEKSFIEKYGRKPLFPSAVTAYDAVRIMASALEKTNGKSGKDLQIALSETKDFLGASLPNITFKENGFVLTPDDIFEMQTVRGGEFVRVE
ncbi:MAG: ABC transporter substrate-binding protein [Patescibacteria group bacterium]